MNASTITANPNALGSIAAQAVQSGIPINSALQSSGFKATGSGPSSPSSGCPAIANCFGLNCADTCNCTYCGDSGAIATCLNLCKQGPGINVGVNTSAITDPIVSAIQTFITGAFPKVALFLFAVIVFVVGFLLLKG